MEAMNNNIDDHFKSVFQVTPKESSIAGPLIASGKEPPRERFIQSSSFIGSKPGYYFANGSKGLGYYFDRRQYYGEKIENENNPPKKRKIEEVQTLEPEDPGKEEQLSHSKELSGNDIERLLEEAEKSGLAQLDSNSLKQMLLSFEKKINKNQKLRMKYPDDPSKFMESEIELHEQVQELYAIAAYPDLYNDLVESGSVLSILGMITHENTDISIAVVGFIQELLEADTVQEVPEAIRLVEEIINNQGLELLTQNLSRLDESNDEDAQGVHNTLAIIENLVEIKSDYASTIGTTTHILTFLLNRVRVKTYDANKSYAAEVLSILLQSSKENRDFIGNLKVRSGVSDSTSSESGDEKCDGLDALLQSLALYRKKDPVSLDETEMLDNLFLCLYSLLLEHENQMKFIHDEGFELMIRCVKEKKHAAGRAIKAINYAISKNLAASLKLIEAGGLKFLFPMFMGRGLPENIEKKKANHPDRLELENTVASIISQLCLQLTFPLTSDGKYPTKISEAELIEVQQRLLGKFIENDYEKVNRAVDFFVKHKVKLLVVEDAIEQLIQNEEELDEDEVLAERIEGGLPLLQETAIIVAYSCLIDASVLSLVDSRLLTANSNVLEVLEVIEENIAILGDNIAVAKEENNSNGTTIDTNNEEFSIARLQHIKDLLEKVLVSSGKVEVETVNDNQ